MKRLFFILVIASVFVSCSNEDKIVPFEGEKTISGVFNYDQPQIIEFEGKTITLMSEDMIGADIFDENQIKTKAESAIIYETIPNYTVAMKNTRIRLSRVPGLAPGIYFCDVCSFHKTIAMPSIAYAATVMVPSPAGYSNYSDQSTGINWTMTSSSSGISLSMSFATIIVNYDILGRQYGWVVPVDGRTVRIPYKYFYN